MRLQSLEFPINSAALPYDPRGPLYITEEGWQNEWHGHPYKLQLGWWTDNGRFQRFADGATQNHASGTYLVASAKLWHPAAEPDRGLGLFLQFGTAPAAVAAVRRHYGAGCGGTRMALNRTSRCSRYAPSTPSARVLRERELYGVHNAYSLTNMSIAGS